MKTRVKFFSLVLVSTLVIVLMAVPGTLLKAQDFEPMSYSAESCDYGGEFLSVEALDESTVKFTLCYPDPAFPSKAAFAALQIQSSDYLEATGGGGDLLEKPVGTGPYMLEEWVHGESLTLKRFDDYWGTPAITETLVFRWNTEAAARLNELQAGTIDGMDNVGPEDFTRVRETAGLALFERPGTNVFYIGLNNRFPPLDDVHVRQALAMSIDRQRIVDQFYPPGSIVASQFMPPSIFGFTPEVSWYDFDPEAGAALMAEAGFPDGFEIDLSYRDVVRSYLPQPGIVAQEIAAQLLENLNVTVNINVMESGEFLDAALSGQLPFHMLGWGADYPDATNFLDYHFGPGGPDVFGDRYSEITEPLSRAAVLSDPAERLTIYIEANTAIKDQVPMIPVAHGGSAVAYNADVEGAHTSPLGMESFAVMNPGGRDTFVWMQNAEPISLYCADETDGETLRACRQINEALLAFEVGGAGVVPSLAESYEANEESTEWTFHLREGVKFHDGSDLDANDVVMSYAVQWDASHPLHVGRAGDFTYFSAYYNGFLNAPAAE